MTGRMWRSGLGSMNRSKYKKVSFVEDGVGAYYEAKGLTQVALTCARSF